MRCLQNESHIGDNNAAQNTGFRTIAGTSLLFLKNHNEI